jgi:hypothetical protein
MAAHGRERTKMTEMVFTPEEMSERQALLEVRAFITKHGTKEVDAYCAQRLHDIRMDARHRAKKEVEQLKMWVDELANLDPAILDQFSSTTKTSEFMTFEPTPTEADK